MKRNSIAIGASAVLLLALALTVAFAITWSTAWANRPKYMDAAALRLATSNPNAAPTPTPFQPIIPTASAVVQPTMPAADAIAAQPPQPTAEVPAQAPVAAASPAVSNVKKKDGQVDILILGSDQRQNEGGFRTDEIMFVSIDTKKHKASVISFPRDLYVDIPGWGSNKINTAMQFGGFDLLAQTLEANFGIRPDHYMLTNFWSFVETVDSLGGINVMVPEELYDQCEPPKTGTCHVSAGLVHMDGETALWYVRSRRTTSDFARTERGRDVVKVLFLKMMSLDAVTRFPDLYTIYSKHVETDLQMQDLIPLLPVASTIASDQSRVKFFGITSEDVTMTMTWEGMSVLTPDMEKIQPMIQQAME